jgi:hypothetical protein
LGLFSLWRAGAASCDPAAVSGLLKLGARLFLAAEAELVVPKNAALTISAAIAAPINARRLYELPISPPMFEGARLAPVCGF